MSLSFKFCNSLNLKFFTNMIIKTSNIDFLPLQCLTHVQMYHHEHFLHRITEIQMYTYIKIYVEKSHRSHFTKISLDLLLQVKTGLADHELGNMNFKAEK